MQSVAKARKVRSRIRKRVTTYRENLELIRERVKANFRCADISIFHEFSPPPSGGGHQFLRALWGEFERQGLRIENNQISRTTHACLFNSFNFDFKRLQFLKRAGCRMVHRVDGPIGVYRGWDDGTDQQIWEINRQLADVTIFQSNYSLQKHLELGMTFRSPQVITNAVDPAIFHPNGKISFSRQRKTRIIAISWSDNLNKGADIYQWVEEHLDWQRFDFTFVGRSPLQFTKINMVDPLPSHQLADLLRQHDIFITASRYESCSNALLEALACGLPVLYIASGSHAELVGEAGLAFCEKEEISSTLNQLVAEYEMRQAALAPPLLTQVADRYLEVMGIKSV